MLAADLWRLFRLALVLIAVTSAQIVLTESAFAQCSCSSDAALGTCAIRVLQPGDNSALGSDAYPDQFPGPGTVVSGDSGDFLYVADFFSGRAYVFEYVVSPIAAVKIVDRVVPSPAGTAQLSGLTAVGETLIWAAGNSLWSTNSEGGEVAELGTINLTAVADAISAATGQTLSAGALGGIVYHPSRESLWAVDIVNDLYFEVQLDGQLVLDAGDRPNFFFNPMRAPLGGAYGNDLTYVANEQGEFFDVLAGPLSAGRPNHVFRLHAVAGADFEIGDETGVRYALDDQLESPEFPTGIVHWQDSCSSGQGSEFVFDLSLSGASPRLIEVAGDTPQFGTPADFQCTPISDTSAELTWRKDLPYETLTIVRRNLSTGVETEILSTTFEEDSGSTLDEGIPPGTYEYIATTSTETADVPELRCRLNIGRGRSVNLGAAGDNPYGVTLADGEIVVADLSGTASILDSGLQVQSTLPSPFTESGTTTGIAYRPANQRLFWMQDTGSAYLLAATNMAGEVQGDVALIESPLNFVRGMQLGDVAYDGANDYFWTVDRLTSTVFPISPSGTIPTPFETQQLSLGEGTILGGGVSVFESSPTSVTLDLTAGTVDRGFASDFVRVEFNLDDLTFTERFRFDLTASFDAASPGSIAVNGDTAFVTALDTGAVYELAVSSRDLPFFRRGDVNDDEAINISDPSALLLHLFRSAPEPTCPAAADANRDDALQLADAVFLFNYLFVSGEAPPAPFPSCGPDPDTALDCSASSCSP